MTTDPWADWKRPSPKITPGAIPKHDEVRLRRDLSRIEGKIRLAYVESKLTRPGMSIGDRISLVAGLMAGAADELVRLAEGLRMPGADKKRTVVRWLSDLLRRLERHIDKVPDRLEWLVFWIVEKLLGRIVEGAFLRLESMGVLR